MRKNQIFFVGLLLILSVKSFNTYQIYQKYYSQRDLSEFKVYGSGDQQDYLKIAYYLKNKFIYTDKDVDYPTESAAWRPPVYPFVLSLLFYLSQNVFTILVLKMLLEAVVIGFVSAHFFKRKPKLLVVVFGLLLFEPYFLKYSATFLSESITAIFILFTFYLYLNRPKKGWLLVVFMAISLLCHPVSSFFIGCLLVAFLYESLKKNWKRSIGLIAFFVALISLWPLRNQLTFNKGLFLTSSQGVALSKAWNEAVKDKFSNVKGDLADEDLNLKYLSQEEISQLNTSTINSSKLYTKAAVRFIENSSFEELLKTAMVKIKSNFKPFPEIKSKFTLERLAVVFRIIYLLFLIQCTIYILSTKNKSFSNKKYKISIFIICIFLGQTIMSIYIYTGLRFNSIYNLALLMGLVLFNYEHLEKKIVSKS